MTDNSKLIDEARRVAHDRFGTDPRLIRLLAQELEDAEARIAKLHEANVKLAQQGETQRAAIRRTLVDRRIEPAPVIPLTPGAAYAKGYDDGEEDGRHGTPLGGRYNPITGERIAK